MRSRPLIAIAVLATIVSSAAVVPSSEAGGIGRLRSDYKPGEVITAYSRYGNGSIKSVVRLRDLGWQVRLPKSGNWTYCRRSCEETLRVQTIDFFSGGNSIDDGGYGSLARECGIFGCLGGSYEFSF